MKHLVIAILITIVGGCAREQEVEPDCATENSLCCEQYNDELFRCSFTSRDWETGEIVSDTDLLIEGFSLHAFAEHECVHHGCN